ncbi:unnamed protein product, partial [Mesorhabditis spiculigera]
MASRDYHTFPGDDISNQGGLVFRMDFAADPSQQLVQQIQQNIRQINEQVNILDGWIPRLSARAGEGEHQRQVFGEKNHSLQALCKETNKLMKQLVDKSHNDRTLRVHRERLSDDYTSVLSRFQETQRRAAAKEKDDVKNIREMTINEQDEQNYQRDVVDSQRQQHMQRNQQVNIQEIKDRQEAIAQLEQDINDVNSIFSNLARIVHEQGTMVDSIEDSVDHAQIYVEQGNRDVQQAVYYNEKARKKKMMLCCFLFILAFILGLTLYFGIKR